MRRQDRHHEPEGEESAFVSMTDMTVSFLFIVMILLAFFASQYSDTDVVPKVELDRVTEILKFVRNENEVLKDENLKLKDDNQQLQRDVSRLQAEISNFQTQVASLEREIEELRDRLRRTRKVDPLEQYLTATARERRRILELLQTDLQTDFPDLKIVISQESDALRFEGDGLFDTGQFALRRDKREIVERVAERLNDILPCYTVGELANWRDDCNRGFAIIEAIQIEGHTDSTGTESANLLLSTNRANTTFMTMSQKVPHLLKHLNARQQPVLSVAGYGQMRPAADNDTLQGRSTNRRIDLRIIMQSPSSVAEIDEIREALKVPFETRESQ